MKARSHDFSGRIAIVAAVLGISMLGNLRSQASEATPPHPNRSSAAHRPMQVNDVRVVDADPDVMLESGSDVDDVSSAKGSASADGDDGHLVPAIYAWDPDVRFIYYRRISKWM